jgi:hypothetical protein
MIPMIDNPVEARLRDLGSKLESPAERDLT